MQNKVIEVLEKEKACLPIHVAKYLGIDTLIANALLESLVSRGIILKTKSKIGDSYIYYLPGYKEEALRLLESYLEKEVPPKNQVYKFLKENKIVTSRDLPANLLSYLDELEDIAIKEISFIKGDEIKYWRYYKLSKEEAEKIIIDRFYKEEEKKVEEVQKAQEVVSKEISKEVKPKVEVVKRKKEVKVKKSVNLVNVMRELGRVITKFDEDTYLIEIEVNNLLKQKYIVIIKDKKKISESDITFAFAKSNEFRKPVIILTNGSLSSNAKELLKVYEGLVNIIKV